jgi:hypothetical protein
LDWIGLDWIGLDWIGLDWIVAAGCCEVNSLVQSIEPRGQDYYVNG